MRNERGRSTLRVLGGSLLGLFAAVLLAAPATSAAGGEFGANADIARSDETGRVIFVGTDPGAPIDAPAGVTADSPASEAAVTYLRDHAAAFGISGDELNVTEVTSNPSGGSTVHSEQVVDGVPVVGGELIVNLTADNQILSVSGEALPNGGVETEPAISRADAGKAAISAVSAQSGVAASDLVAETRDLRIFDPSLFGGSGRTHLVWEVEVTAPVGAERSRSRCSSTLGPARSQRSSSSSTPR